MANYLSLWLAKKSSVNRILVSDNHPASIATRKTALRLNSRQKFRRGTEHAHSLVTHVGFLVHVSPFGVNSVRQLQSMNNALLAIYIFDRIFQMVPRYFGTHLRCPEV